LVAILLSGCGGNGSKPPYPPLTERLIEAVNAQYGGEYYFSISSASVPAGRLGAAKTAVNVSHEIATEGRGLG
jgi:hypothetical protein